MSQYRVMKLSWTHVDALADQLGVSKFARAKWRERQIPWRWRSAIVAAAVRRGWMAGEADLPRGRLDLAKRRR